MKFWRPGMFCGALLVFLTGLANGAEHPGSSADCGDCHSVTSANFTAPAVIPEQPGFFAQLMGAPNLQGHKSLSCVGDPDGHGVPSGCHAPEKGWPDYLITDLTDRPSDEFCGTCHAEIREPGTHHPSYRADKNQDGVPEVIVRPAAGQEIYSELSPAAREEPLRSHPDALVLRQNSDGTKSPEVALPLGHVVETVDGKPVREVDVVTCTTCHNPHFGYLVEVGSEEEQNRERVGRTKGDGLLRLRDYTNDLCEACH